jgi:AcrR family transcriptional regulator
MAGASLATGRLSKEERREQLLDAAAALVVERGLGGITMEGLADRAGVSKALPYQHFDNAPDVLVALYRREIGWLGGRVVAAVADTADPAARVRAAIHAYFDAVVERGAVLGALSNPATGVAAEADGGQRVGVEFVAELVVEPFGFSGRRARMLASMLLGMLFGAVDSWAHEDGGRHRIEHTVSALIVAALREAHAAERSDGQVPVDMRR